MLSAGFIMLIPLWILIYTCSYGRWLHKKDAMLSATSVYIIGVLSFVASGFIVWRMFT